MRGTIPLFISVVMFYAQSVYSIPARYPAGSTKASRERHRLALAQLALTDPLRYVVASTSSYQGQKKEEKQEIQLPTEEEVKAMPLCDLIKLRPIHSDGEGKNLQFAHLFANHPSVVAIDHNRLTREEIAQAWTRLRWEERGNYHPRKLTETINHHLKNVVKANKQLRDFIEGYWTSFLSINTRTTDQLASRAKQKRERLIDPQFRRNLNERRKKKRAEEKEGRIARKGMTEFELNMIKYHIPKGLSPLELEEASQVFINEYDSKSLATFDMIRYLEEKKYDPLDILAARGQRHRYVIRVAARRGRKTRTDKKRAAKVIFPESTSPSLSSTPNLVSSSSSMPDNSSQGQSIIPVPQAQNNNNNNIIYRYKIDKDWWHPSHF